MEEIKMKVKKWNQKAIIGFCFGVVAVILSASGAGIVAFVLGLLSFQEIRKNRAEHKGYGLAIASLVIGSIWGVLLIIAQFIQRF